MRVTDKRRGVVFRRQIPALALVLCAGGPLLWALTAQRQPPLAPIRPSSIILLPFMNRRAVLYYPNPYNGVPHADIALRSDGKTQRVRGLNDLRGAVRITTPRAALSFVRLTTFQGAIGTDLDAGCEIVSAELIKHYNPELGGWPTFPPYESDSFHSGAEGVLSTEAFRRGRFTPAAVRIVPGGFEVDRWLYEPSRGHGLADAIEHVRELVGVDGSYRRIVLSASPPPRLPSTLWHGALRR